MSNDDNIAGLLDKILSSVAKEKQQEEEIQALKHNDALKKNDVQSKKQTSRNTTTKCKNLVLPSTPSFSLNLKDENSSQPDDFPTTNQTYSGVNWTQLQVYKMLQPDERKKIIQFYSTDIFGHKNREMTHYNSARQNSKDEIWNAIATGKCKNSDWIAAYTWLASLTNSQRIRKFKNISEIIKF
ncbi:hypothetical protein C1H46_038716 [Malus baccata]|uniref:Uncharacterized protein n=1 Tax=Malus baccata TaxID=106549 RepID=A0A540KNE8_MALBA|nr:hypothetical protein C1H46_038716 [Malus baccata]